MPTDILEEARLFLFHFLQGNHNSNDSRHPWRRSWEFAVLHSLRVEAAAVKILAREEQVPSEQEIILIRLAAILHDLGRLEKKEGHAERGAKIAEKWLREEAIHRLDESDVGRVLEMIASHSSKSLHEQDPGKAILKDADTLDEIGAMSILMSGNWVDCQSPFFFYQLRQRLIDEELPFCDQKLAILNTKGAREILMERKAFVEDYIAQLTNELQADSQIEQMLFETS
jgi:HD superfamily phosphodiesterase